MFVIGLVGGVASGKSLVAQQLQRLGAGVLDGDRAGHEVLGEPEVVQAIRERWGAEVFTPDGRVDRRAVAQIVFAETETGARELVFLEQLTHPRIKLRLEEQLRQMAAAGKLAAVLDAPVMFKAGWHSICDTIVFVDAPREVRWARARQRGWSEAEFTRREAAQELLSWKRSQAQAVIDNQGAAEATAVQVEQLWRDLQPRISASNRSTDRLQTTHPHQNHTKPR